MKYFHHVNLPESSREDRLFKASSVSRLRLLGEPGTWTIFVKLDKAQATLPGKNCDKNKFTGVYIFLPNSY
jgi:hypothetical protein